MNRIIHRSFVVASAVVMGAVVSLAAAATPSPAAPAFTITPELTQRVKPLLEPGTKIPLAAEGFKTAAEFAAVAHASHNLKIPFTPLRAKVVSDHLTLEQAIAALQPKADAAAAAREATTEAEADVSGM